MRWDICGLAFALLLSSASGAHEVKFGDIRITHPWTHASPNGATASPVYMTIATVSDKPDRLLGASSPIADRGEFHNHVQSTETMGMEVLPSLPLDRSTPITLSPDGPRLVLLGLHAPLHEFDTFPLTLNFQRAGPTTVEVTVEEPGAAQPREDYGL